MASPLAAPQAAVADTLPDADLSTLPAPLGSGETDDEQREPGREGANDVEDANDGASDAQKQSSIVPASLLDEEPEAQAVCTAVGIFANMAPVCSKCMCETDPSRAQIKSVSKGTRWICNICNSRTTMLSRTFGRWPVPEFSELTQEDQVSFWQELRNQGLVTRDQAKHSLANRVARQRTDKAEANVGGEYLPLSVWAQRGFDVARIVEYSTPQNAMEHPVLGSCYRVAITSLNRSVADVQVRTQVLQAWNSISPRAVTRALNPSGQHAALNDRNIDGLPLEDVVLPDAQEFGLPEQAGLADEVQDDLGDKSSKDNSNSSNSSSSSDSSSTSSSDKKKKKQRASKKKANKKKARSSGKKGTKKSKGKDSSKKLKAEEEQKKRKAEAERKVEQVKREKEEGKMKAALNKNKAFATKVLAKTRVGLGVVEKALASCNSQQVPDLVTAKAREALDSLTYFKTTAEMLLGNPSADQPDFSWEQVNQAVKEGMSAASTINLLIKATAKLSGGRK